MKRDNLRNHLRPYSIVGRRKTTINHAFASAIAPNDEYDDQLVREAVLALGQNPDNDLMCAYCDENPAETWDHVFGLVKGQQYSGFGHTIGNLLPCCKQCNSSKGNKNWREFVTVRLKDDRKRMAKIAQLEQYFSRYLDGYHLGYDEIEKLCPEDMRELQKARDEIIELMQQSDKLAATIRSKIKSYMDSQSSTSA